MECPACKASNPDDNQFCGKCGVSLGTSAAIDRRVEQLLSERFRDRGLIEYQISDNLVNRFTSLLKIGAWVFAPSIFVLGVALAIAGWFGFKTYSDASQKIQSAASAAVSQLQSKEVTAETSIDRSVKNAQTRITSEPNLPRSSRD